MSVATGAANVPARRGICGTRGSDFIEGSGPGRGRRSAARRCGWDETSTPHFVRSCRSGCFGFLAVHGFSPGIPGLHPWLHSCAPAGAKLKFADRLHISSCQSRLPVVERILLFPTFAKPLLFSGNNRARRCLSALRDTHLAPPINRCARRTGNAIRSRFPAVSTRVLASRPTLARLEITLDLILPENYIPSTLAGALAPVSHLSQTPA